MSLIIFLLDAVFSFSEEKFDDFQFSLLCRKLLVSNSISKKESTQLFAHFDTIHFYVQATQDLLYI